MKQDINTFITSAGLVTVAQAQALDVDERLALLREAGEWVAAKGINQWDPAQFSRERGLVAIERGEVYMARLGIEVVGTLRLQWSDESLWGIRADDAGYVHGLAVKRAYAGHRIGLGLLRWAEGQVAATSRRFLRLDCMAENPALRDYYLKCGYRLVGEAELCGWNAALFERNVDAVDAGNYLMSENALSKDWLTPEEDEAWKQFVRGALT